MLSDVLKNWRESISPSSLSGRSLSSIGIVKLRIVSLWRTLQFHEFTPADEMHCFLGAVRFCYHRGLRDSGIVLYYDGELRLFHNSATVYCVHASRCNYVWLKKKLFDYENKIRE